MTIEELRAYCKKLCRYPREDGTSFGKFLATTNDPLVLAQVTYTVHYTPINSVLLAHDIDATLAQFVDEWDKLSKEEKRERTLAAKKEL